jgi:hypothetical protein
MPENSISNVEKKMRQLSHLLYPVMDEHKAAEFLGVKVQTLRNWRHVRKGPPYLKIGSRVLYLENDLYEYRNSKRIVPEG